MMKRAQIVTHTVEVACPHCDASQPNPDNGGFPWFPHEVIAASERDGGKVSCVECDEKFLIVSSKSARVAS